MSRIIVNEFLSLDGVAQAPGGPDEDRDGGFEHGGWHMPYMDAVAGEWVDRALARAGGFLLGRRTYQIFAAYWPTAPEEEGAIAARLNELPKYVVSGTLTEPLAWQNSTLLGDDVAAAVGALRELDGRDLVVFGSTQLVRALGVLGFVDEYLLMIDPLILGGGKRIFDGGWAKPGGIGAGADAGDATAAGSMRTLRLVESRVTETGVILARYVGSEDKG